MCLTAQTEFFSGKFGAVPSGGPASRGGTAKNDEDGGKSGSISSGRLEMCCVANQNYLIFNKWIASHQLF